MLAALENHRMVCSVRLSCDELERLDQICEEGAIICEVGECLDMVGYRSAVGVQHYAGVSHSEFEDLLLRFLCPAGMDATHFARVAKQVVCCGCNVAGGKFE
jgi:hypothetical protein